MMKNNRKIEFKRKVYSTAYGEAALKLGVALYIAILAIVGQVVLIKLAVDLWTK
jgi:hypothetical protein